MGLWGTSLGEESLLGNVQRSVRGAGTRPRPYREEAGWAVVPYRPKRLPSYGRLTRAFGPALGGAEKEDRFSPTA